MELVLARSIAGHDEGQVYVVLGTDGKDVYVFNGKNRLADDPKRKNRRHVQRITHLSKELVAEAATLSKWTDEAARKLIGMYLKEPNKEESKIV